MSSKKLSVRIVSVIISLTFLLTTITPSYASSALRPNLMGDKGNKGRLDATAKKVESELSDEGYTEIADWIANELRLSDLYEIVSQLKDGKLIFTNSYDFIVSDWLGDSAGRVRLKLDIRHAFILKHERGNYVDPVSWDYGRSETRESIHAEDIEIPQEILFALKRLKISIKPVSQYAHRAAEGSKALLFDYRRAIWSLKFHEIDEYYIGRLLLSLSRDANTPKKTITKKLQKLQQKRPETIPIIREKALELLEIDEANFREALQPFIGDYIKIKDAIRQDGVGDDTAEFYSLFDFIIAKEPIPWSTSHREHKQWSAWVDQIVELKEVKKIVAYVSTLDKKFKALNKESKVDHHAFELNYLSIISNMKDIASVMDFQEAGDYLLEFSREFYSIAKRSTGYEGDTYNWVIQRFDEVMSDITGDINNVAELKKVCNMFLKITDRLGDGIGSINFINKNTIDQAIEIDRKYGDFIAKSIDMPTGIHYYASYDDVWPTERTERMIVFKPITNLSPGSTGKELASRIVLDSL